MVLKDGVNLRKTPSTSAPKLMMEYPNDSFDIIEVVDYVWDNTPRKRNMVRDAFHLEVNSVVEVVGESDGWTRIAADNWADMQPWISSQFVRPVQPVVISDAQYIRMMKNVDWMKGEIRTHGKYAGMSLEYDPLVDCWVVSKFSDSKMYTTAKLNIETVYEPNMRGFRLSENGEMFTLKFGSDLRMDGAGVHDENEIDLDKFTDSQLDRLFGTLVPGLKFEYETRFFEKDPSADDFFERYGYVRTKIK